MSCGESIRGRSDKKFCDDHCRNAYNNDFKNRGTDIVRSINSTLRRNRQILESLLPGDSETVRAPKEKLVLLGYQFNYSTHMHTTESGTKYCFCYDYGYTSVEKDYLMILRKPA